MDLERQNEKIKWFKKEDLRIKQIYEENETQISVNLNGYNLCFTLMMFDFIDHIKKDLLLDVKVTKLRNNPRGTHHLFDDHPLRLHQFIVGRRGAHIYRSSREALELVERQRTVVARGGEAEAVLDEVLLASPIAAVHRPDLRQRDVALVDDHQIVVGEVVQEAERRHPRATAVEIARIVLDSRAITELLDHFEVELSALLDALRLGVATLTFEELYLLAQVELYLTDSSEGPFARRDEEVGGRDANRVQLFEPLSRQRVYAVDSLYLVVEKVEPHSHIAVSQHHVDRVAADAEGGGSEVAFGARVENIDEVVQQFFAADGLAGPHLDHTRLEIFGIAYAVNAAHARDDYHIPSSRHQRCRGAKAQFVYLVVYLQVFLYIGVRGGHIRLWLIVIVVGDEILDAVLGKETLELGVELCREGFVVAQHEDGTVQLGDDVGNGEGLARARHTQQRRVLRAAPNGAHEPFDRLGLVARRLIFRYEFEIHPTKIEEKSKTERFCKPHL